MGYLSTTLVLGLVVTPLSTSDFRYARHITRIIYFKLLAVVVDDDRLFSVFLSVEEIHSDQSEASQLDHHERLHCCVMRIHLPSP